MLNQASTPPSIAASEDAYDRKNRRHRYQSISTKFVNLGVTNTTAQATIINLVAIGISQLPALAA